VEAEKEQQVVVLDTLERYISFMKKHYNLEMNVRNVY